MNDDPTPLAEETNPNPTCACCERRLMFQWSDTHGIGVCCTCGLPYIIYHYAPKEEGGARLEKPPECALNEKGIEIAKRYWTETQRRVFPAHYDMGIGHGGRSYSGATSEDCRLFSEWYHRTYPKTEAA